MRKRALVRLICSKCKKPFLRNKCEVRLHYSNYYCSKKCERYVRIVRMKRLAKTNNLAHKNRSSTILTEDNVKKIRQDYASGMTVRSICSYTGMSENAIRCLVKNKTWKHVV